MYADPTWGAAAAGPARSWRRSGGRGAATRGWATPPAADEGPIRVVMFAAMGAMLVASLAVPGRVRLRTRCCSALAYLVVRAAAPRRRTSIVSATTPRCAASVRRLASTILPGGAAARPGAAHSDGPARGAVLDRRAGDRLRRPARPWRRGWHVEPGHFAERHGLIIIIALGESIVSLGVGADGARARLRRRRSPRCWGWRRRPRCGGRTSTSSRSSPNACWSRAPGASADAIARDSYSYLHLPMVARHRRLRRSASSTTLGHSTRPLRPRAGDRAVRRRRGVPARAERLPQAQRRHVNRPRLVASAVLVALIPPPTAIPALAGLALVAAPPAR